jgi:hypothetical protein
VIVLSEVRKVSNSLTRYDVVMHRHIASICSCVVCLEINDSPSGHCQFIIYCASREEESAFIEWETLEDAINAFEQFWPTGTMKERFPQLKGFKRYIVSGPLIPWFYAIGMQRIVGDFAFSEECKAQVFLESKSGK